MMPRRAMAHRVHDPRAGGVRLGDMWRGVVFTGAIPELS
jgi:hypothetical protein